MSEQEEVDLYVAPFVEPDEQVEAALEMVVESWKDEYTQHAAATLQSESSLVLEYTKAIGHWRSVVAPLFSLSALIRESIADFDDAPDLAIRASGTLAACYSIMEMMDGVLSNVYVLHQHLNENQEFSSKLAEQAEDMLRAVGGKVPSVQLELFEDQVYSD